MEKAIYELRPYFFLSVALSALNHSQDSKLMMSSGMLLLGAMMVVILARMKHRGYIQSQSQYQPQTQRQRSSR